VFLPGSYLVEHNVSINAPGFALDINTIGDVLFDSNATIMFGSASSPPIHVLVIQASIILVGSSHLSFSGDQAVTFQDSFFAISGPIPLFGELTLSGGSFVTSNLTFQAMYYNLPPDVFTLTVPSSSSLQTIGMENGYADSFNNFLVLNVPSINTLFINNMTFFGDQTGGLVIGSASQTIPVVDVVVNGSGILGMSTAIPSALAVSPNSSMVFTETYFSGSLSVTAINSSGTTMTWLHTDSSDSFLNFASFYQVVFLDVSFLRTNLSLPSGGDHLVSGLETSFSTYFVNVNGNIFLEDLYSYACAYTLQTGLSGSVQIASSSFMRNDSQFIGYVKADSSYVFVYDTDMYQYYQSPGAMLFLSNRRATSNPLLHIDAAIDAIDFNVPLGFNYSVEGSLAITYALTGNGGVVELNGNLIFVADPVLGMPVEVDGVHIVKSPTPGAISLITAAVWWASGGAANFSALSSLNPSEHNLEVIIANGYTTDPIDGSQLVGLFSGPGVVYSAQGFIDVIPTLYNAQYGFGGSALNFPSNISYNVTSFTCPSDCNGQTNGACVGANTCNCTGIFSGYTCACSNLPADVACSEDADLMWDITNSVVVGHGAQFVFPDGTGAMSNSGVTNQGTFIMKNALYDFPGLIANYGHMEITSGVTQVMDIYGRCVFVTSARMSSSTLNLATGASLTMHIDLSQASTSICPPFKGNTSTTATSVIRGASSGRASKIRSTFDMDSSSLSGGTLVINLSGPISSTVELKLITSRNATDQKSLAANTSTPLLVQVNAPPGTCATVTNLPNLVSLLATSCPTPSTHPSKSTTWIQWGIPVIIIASLAILVLVIVIIALTVPTVNQFFRPYANS